MKTLLMLCGAVIACGCGLDDRFSGLAKASDMSMTIVHQQGDMSPPDMAANGMVGDFGSATDMRQAIVDLASADLSPPPFWVAQNSGTTTNTLSGIWGTSSTNIFVVGSGGLILHSGDGKTWTKQTTNSTSDLLAVGGTGTGYVAAVGNGGATFETTNGGATWGSIAGINATVNLLGVYGMPSGELVVVGLSSEVFLRNAPGGWLRCDTTNSMPGNPADLGTAWGESGTDFYVAGSGGNIFHSTNKGTSYSVVTSPSTTNGYAAMWGTSDSNIFAVGSGGIVSHSSDGSTFTSQTSAASNQFILSGVMGSGASTVYAVGRNGSQGGLYLTQNSGMTWTDVTPPAMPAVNGIWIALSGDIYVVGYNGTILHHGP